MIAHLSDRLRGGAPFRRRGRLNPGLSRAERRRVQERLIERDFDIGKPDEMIGERTRAAIEAFQTAAGLPVDCRAGARVLKALEAEKAVKTDVPATVRREAPEQR